MLLHPASEGAVVLPVVSKLVWDDAMSRTFSRHDDWPQAVLLQQTPAGPGTAAAKPSDGTGKRRQKSQAARFAEAHGGSSVERALLCDTPRLLTTHMDQGLTSCGLQARVSMACAWA